MKRLTRIYTTLAGPFLSGARIDIRLVSVFLVINGLVFANSCLHDPTIGYDNSSFFEYIEALSRLHLVTPQDSREFFSPPLPFAVPAALMALTGMDVARAAEFGQFLNVALSIGLTWYLIRACGLIGSSPTMRLGALVFLGILPVYYKSFAFVRGEPFVAFFTVIILYYTLLMVTRRQFDSGNAIILGLCMGLSALSRQWGILLFPAVFLLLAYCWIRLRPYRASILRAMGLCLMITVLVGGWFYLSLRYGQGSFTAFNRDPETSFSLRNQPPEFYFGSGLSLLFTRPVRPSFPNEFMPIFYSDVWGDYWGFFSVSSTDTRSGEHINGRRLTDIISAGRRPYWLQTNYESISTYLGRVNLVSVFPSTLALCSLGMAAVSVLNRRDKNVVPAGRNTIYGFLLLAIGTVMTGFLWFLIMYPNIGKGDTIKATYVLHIFPLVAVIVGVFLEQVKERSPLAHSLLLGGLCIVFLHNFSAMVTHY